MRKFLLISLLCVFSISSQDRFINKLCGKYERDSSIRPYDSLLYIPHIMNLVSKPSFDRMSIEERRHKLFDVLSKGRLQVSYHYALDTLEGDVYNNPRGDMDYINKKTPKQLHFYPIELSNYAEVFAKEMKALIHYAQNRHPDCLFDIAGIIGLDYNVYWSIVNGELFAIQYNTTNYSIHEYSADHFLESIATDDMFSVEIRLTAP